MMVKECFDDGKAARSLPDSLITTCYSPYTYSLLEEGVGRSRRQAP